ncbi:PepSY domain-containing protein (plasmid) [Sinorhizobium medicae]|uniref:PepSY domain-containing protein n=1 Tax=Sinorhizobium medicae TaxID=110321 RepID=UPI001F34BD82|nr:PepSY domain-containing protein [Sinorhizobium medicae]WQO57068.1 PepSY domain-containing protein [Sinorhizobium medicae]
MRKIIIALSLAAAFGGTALASEKCNAAMADWKPRETLQTKLEGADITMHLVGFVERQLTRVGGYHIGRRRLLRV